MGVGERWERKGQNMQNTQNIWEKGGGRGQNRKEQNMQNRRGQHERRQNRWVKRQNRREGKGGSMKLWQIKFSQKKLSDVVFLFLVLPMQYVSGVTVI